MGDCCGYVSDKLLEEIENDSEDETTHTPEFNNFQMADSIHTQIPSELREELAKTFSLATAPATTEEFAAALPTELVNSIDDLCVTESSRHKISVDDKSYHVNCVLDTIILPFLLNTSGDFEITSESPVSGTVIRINGSLGTETIEVTPKEAVMSFGVKRTSERPDDEEVTPRFVYSNFCPYVNAFVSEAEYNQWVAETTDVISTPMSFEDAFDLAQGLINDPSQDFN